MTKTFLSDIWFLYFHDNSNDWGISSFKLVTTISSVEDFCIIYKLVDKDWYKGMFFIFREDIVPRWEDSYNLNGGCYSYKIANDEIDDKWFDLCSKVLGESIGIETKYSLNINGISITPKKNSNILRIWLKDNDIVNPEYYNISISKFSTLLYKKHVT